mgnify:CR=1 FL=1
MTKGSSTVYPAVLICSALLLLSNAVHLQPGNLQLLVPNNTRVSPLCCQWGPYKYSLDGASVDVGAAAAFFRRLFSPAKM